MSQLAETPQQVPMAAPPGSSEQSSLRVLHVGPLSGTCRDRANALRRLGHRVEHIDPRSLLPATVWVDRVTWRLGGQWFARRLKGALAKMLAGREFDVCIVESGEWVPPSVIALLRRHAPRVINWNIDDPFGGRDGARFAAYRRALPCYDLCAVMRAPNVTEALALGARRAVRVYRGADEVSHAPRDLTARDRELWSSEVLFLGTWFPERGPFMLEFLAKGVPLTIRGSGWHKAPEWNRLRQHWKGGALAGDDYAKAIQCAKVSLGLTSKGNRDQQTSRSVEIPALGGLLCAIRTPEHTDMYREDAEALFWSDAAECAEKCRFALTNEPRRAAIAAAGHARVRAMGRYNQIVMANLLRAALDEAP